MTIPTWKYVDRYELLKVLRALTRDPGPDLCVVTGPDDADRVTAGDLAEDFFSELGWHTVRVRQTMTSATTTRQVLARAWRAVDRPANPLYIPRSLGQAGHLDAVEIIGEIVHICRNLPPSRAVFVFDTVDPVDPLPRAHFQLFNTLARDSGARVVLFSRAESGTVVPAGTPAVVIGDLPMAEVRMSLKTSPKFASVQEPVITSLLRDLEALSDEDRLPAFDAYDVLQAGLGGSVSGGY